VISPLSSRIATDNEDHFFKHLKPQKQLSENLALLAYLSVAGVRKYKLNVFLLITISSQYSEKIIHVFETNFKAGRSFRPFPSGEIPLSSRAVA
jgi:hypothetical protein